MDDRGVARGKCTMPSCSCLQYERQGRVKRCTCGHVPTKHDVANQPDVIRDEDSDFDSQFEECISLDHTQPPSTPVSDSMPSSDSALTVPQAWSMPSATQSPTVGEHGSALLLRGATIKEVPNAYLYSTTCVVLPSLCIVELSECIYNVAAKCTLCRSESHHV